MNAETKAAQTVSGVQADYGVKGPDFDTALLGAITPSIIDADRLVRCEWRNGFPNWWLYRTALCGDSLYLAPLRHWTVAFSIAYCMAGGVRRDAYSDELACVAAWDALHMLLYPAGGVNGQIQPYRETAAALGVHHSTYKRLRSHLYASLKGSLDEYWIQLGAAYRHVILYERRNSERSRTSAIPGIA